MPCKLSDHVMNATCSTTTHVGNACYTCIARVDLGRDLFWGAFSYKISNLLFIVCLLNLHHFTRLKLLKVTYISHLHCFKNWLLCIFIKNEKNPFLQSFEKALGLNFYLLTMWSIPFCIYIKNIRSLHQITLAFKLKVTFLKHLKNCALFFEKSLFAVLNFLICIFCIWCVCIWLEATSSPLI